MKLKEVIANSKLVQSFAIGVVRKSHVLANPNLYFECPKRMVNPDVFLDDTYLSNCKVLSCREKMLEEMPKNAVCAEVGVAEGYFSEKILSICEPQKLYMIEYGHAYCEKLRIKFKTQIECGMVEILEGDSVEMLSELPNKSLDFVYLDATHDYEHPSKELQICMKRVKDSGYIAGHDYTRFSLWEAQQYGVVEAVNEFAVKNSYEMVFLTMDMLSSNSSYALKKR